MSNFNLQNRDWLEVVFQDKNKAYGAYQLRKENDKTTLKALLLTSGFVLGACLLLSFTTKDEVILPNPTLPDIVIVSPTDVFRPKEEATKPRPKGEENTKKYVSDKPKDPVIVEDEPEVKPLDKPIVKPIDNPNGNETGDPNKKGTEGTPEGTGLPTEKPTSKNDGGGTGFVPEGPVGMGMLTKNVSFPGGIDRFRTYVGDHYRMPDDLEAGAKIKLMISFVVEIDGSMTGFKLINSADKELEKEAFRVLKSMKTKWIPGEVNGQKVRSYFSLPIILQVNEEN